MRYTDNIFETLINTLIEFTELEFGKKKRKIFSQPILYMEFLGVTSPQQKHRKK